jgi:hypothetical protein
MSSVSQDTLPILQHVAQVEIDLPTASTKRAQPSTSANANIIIRCVDPEAILARLPDDIQELAKIYNIDKEYSKRKYHADEKYREENKKASVQRRNLKYANDPEYRAKQRERARGYYQSKLKKNECV